eukprot:c24710_g1_i1 orf=371-2488(-)
MQSSVASRGGKLRVLLVNKVFLHGLHCGNPLTAPKELSTCVPSQLVPSSERECLEAAAQQRNNGALQRHIRACGSIMQGHAACGFRNTHAPGNVIHSIAHIRDSRWFCVVAHLNQHVEIQAEGSLDALGVHMKTSHEIAQTPPSKVFAEPHAKSKSAVVFQDGCSQTIAPEEALQAFEDLIDEITDSRKDSDVKGLEALEALLAQVDESAVPDDQHRIGVACYKLAQLYSSCKEPGKVVSYAQRGFKIFKSLGSSRAKHAACRCLYAIASAYYSMGEFEKALVQSEQLELILQKLEKSSTKEDATFLRCAVQTLLIKSKMSAGRHQETLPHFRKYVELKEKLVEPGNPDLGAAYIQAAEAFLKASYPADAIGFGVKALQIHMNYFGSSSYQVAYVRRLLSEAYYELGHFEDCLSEYDRARPILETLGDNSVENMAPFIMRSALSLIELRRYQKAILRLEEIIRNTSKACDSHALALATLTNVYASLNMDKEFSACCKMALDVLENDQKASISSGQSVCLLASSHKEQKHYEQAIVLYKKALGIFCQCLESEAALKAADTEGEIGIALLRLGKFSQAAPYLKNYALKNKNISGSDNKRLLAVHNRLGGEYLQVGRQSEALEQLETAKLLLSRDPTGINEAIIIALNQNLATVYKVLGRIEEAVECQKTAVDAVKKSKHEETRALLEQVERPLEALLQRHAESTSEN